VSAHDVSKSGDIGGVNGGVSPSPKYIWGSTHGEGEDDVFVIETSSMTALGVALESIVMVCVTGVWLRLALMMGDALEEC
jgi:hypothetical protein